MFMILMVSMNVLYLWTLLTTLIMILVCEGNVWETPHMDSRNVPVPRYGHSSVLFGVSSVIYSFELCPPWFLTFFFICSGQNIRLRWRYGQRSNLQ